MTLGSAWRVFDLDEAGPAGRTLADADDSSVASGLELLLAEDGDLELAVLGLVLDDLGIGLGVEIQRGSVDEVAGSVGCGRDDLTGVMGGGEGLALGADDGDLARGLAFAAVVEEPVGTESGTHGDRFDLGRSSGGQSQSDRLDSVQGAQCCTGTAAQRFCCCGDIGIVGIEIAEAHQQDGAGGDTLRSGNTSGGSGLSAEPDRLGRGVKRGLRRLCAFEPEDLRVRCCQHQYGGGGLHR